MLHSLATFLRHAVSSLSNTPITSDEAPATYMNTWYLVASFLNQEAHQSFNELLQPSVGSSQPRDHRYWQPEVELGEGTDDFPHMIHSTPYLTFDSHWTISDLVNGALIKGLSNAETVGSTNITLVAVNSDPWNLLRAWLNSDLLAYSKDATFDSCGDVSRLCSFCVCTEREPLGH